MKHRHMTFYWPPLRRSRPEPAHRPGRAANGEMMDQDAHEKEMMAPDADRPSAPAHLLERKDVLALTTQQVTRLTALRDAAKAAHDAAEADVKTHHDALARTMAAPAPDTAAVRQHFQAAHAAMGNAHWAMLRAAAQAKAVLTEAQRGRVDGWADAMQMRGH